MGFLFFVLQHMHIYKHVLKYKYISLHSYSEQKTPPKNQDAKI